MNKTKKQIFYELDPRYFKDGSGNGRGDLNGFLSKIDYFKFLGINNIILQNLLSSNSDDKIQSFSEITNELGDINLLSTIIKKASAQKTNIFLEISIGKIKESHKWFRSAEAQVENEFNNIIKINSSRKNEEVCKYSSKVKGYYAIDEATQEVPLNWKNSQVLDQFLKVIRFWIDLGIRGFVFKDFEYLTDTSRTTLMSAETLKELRKFYRAIKEINDEITIIAKSSIIPLKTIKSYVQGSTKVFDYFISQQISLLGTSPKFGIDAKGVFSTKHLASSIKVVAQNPMHILTFGTELTGRINSRWGNHGQFSKESSQVLGMLLALTPASFSIYYGDEIGTLNIGLTHLDDFQDETLIRRQRQTQIAGLKEIDFMKAQVHQNPINARSLMAWSEEKNGGFSDNEKTITPVNSTYKEINVKNQFMDESSTLLFYKQLIDFVNNPTYSIVINSGKFKVSSLHAGVIKYSFRFEKKELIVVTNLTDKVKRIHKQKNGNVILSSYFHKHYDELPTTLEAFEGVVISKGFNEIEVIKEKKTYQDTSQKYEEKIQDVKKQEVLYDTDDSIESTKWDVIATDESMELKIESKDDKTNPVEIKQAKKVGKVEIQMAKEVALAEKNAAKQLKKDGNNFSIMEEELLEGDRTTLKEEEIAPTTQINVDDFDDFEAFLNRNKK